MNSSESINCVMVGMRGMPITALLRQLRGETDSPLAAAARAAADEMSQVLGPWPKFSIRLLRTSGVVDYDAVMGRLMPDRKNLICVGVTAKTYDTACAFIKRLRHAGENSLAVAIYDGALSSDTTLASYKLAVLSGFGFDRIVSHVENPAAIEAVMQSLVRNDAMRSLGQSVIEKIGPLRIMWDSAGTQPNRHIKKIYLEDDTGNKVNIHLTGKELSLFERLAHTPSVTVSKKELLGYLYAGQGEAETGIIHVFVCKMRGKIAWALRKLGYNNVGNEDGPIDTTGRKGYLLNPNFGQSIVKVAVRPADEEPPESRAEDFVL